MLPFPKIHGHHNHLPLLVRDGFTYLFTPCSPRPSQLFLDGTLSGHTGTRSREMLCNRTTSCHYFNIWVFAVSENVEGFLPFCQRIGTSFVHCTRDMNRCAIVHQMKTFIQSIIWMELCHCSRFAHLMCLLLVAHRPQNLSNVLLTYIRRRKQGWIITSLDRTYLQRTSCWTPRVETLEKNQGHFLRWNFLAHSESFFSGSHYTFAHDTSVYKIDTSIVLSTMTSLRRTLCYFPGALCRSTSTISNVPLFFRFWTTPSIAAAIACNLSDNLVLPFLAFTLVRRIAIWEVVLISVKLLFLFYSTALKIRDLSKTRPIVKKASESTRCAHTSISYTQNGARIVFLT